GSAGSDCSGPSVACPKRRREAFDLSENPYRLPRTVVPHKYRIRLEPRLEEATISGSETIDVTVEAPTDHIVLNSPEIEIVSAQLTNDAATIEIGRASDREA